MKINLQKRLLLLLGLSLTTSLAISQTTTFSYTGTIQTYVVPAGVTSIQIEATGAEGGKGSIGAAGTGGKGAEMTGAFNVTPGQVLNILVGQKGGGSTYVGGGGGGSFVWDDITSTLMIAAGGGGGGGYTDAGGTFTVGLDASTTENGTNGNNFSNGGGVSGNGGTTPTAINWASGGAGWNSNGANGTVHGCSSNSTGGQTPLSGGAGGTGGGDGLQYGGFGGGGGGNARCGAVGGGGGGGYSGGGCGGETVINQYNAGGGAGSFNGGTDQVNTAGVGIGNGTVSITVLCSGLITTVSSDSICEGEEVTLSATSIGTGVISWDGGITDGVAFTPSVGTTTYTATSTDPADCSFSIDIVVTAFPTVDAGSDINICEGDSAILVAGGTAMTYSWDGGAIDSDYFTPTSGTTTYTLTGETNGCEATDMVDVTYNVIDPSVTVTGVTLTAAQAGATYQWVNCPSFSLIGGATNQTFAPSQDGNYAVIINLNGCVDTSACETVAGVGISDLDNLAIKVLPNPNNGTFQLSLGQAIDGTIVIFGLDGKIIRSEAIAQRTNIDFSFENLDAGVYLMQLNTALGNSTVRIVVQ